MREEQPNDKPAEDRTQDSFPEDFARQAEQEDIGFLEEFVYFLRDNKKWWLIPLVGSLLLLGLVSFFAASGVAPFIYTVF